MASEWQSSSLERLCKQITDGKHGDCKDEEGSGFYFLSVKDVVDNRLIYEQARQINRRDFEETHKRTALEAGDVLFTNTGTIGRMAIVKDDAKTARTTFQKSVAILKPRRDLVDPFFLYYLLKANNKRLSSFAEGTTQKNLLLKDLKNFTVRTPPLIEQSEIIGILRQLDQSIELSRTVNETVEQVARAIFKSWFMDFDPVRAKAEGREPEGMDAATAAFFPSEFLELNKDSTPKGWVLASLDSVGNFLNGIALQKYPAGPDEDWLPAIKIAQLRRGSTDGADRISPSLPSQYLIRDGDLLFSWSGSLEVEIWCGGDGALNQHLFKVTSEAYPTWFIYLWLREHLAHFREIAESKVTTMGHIQRHHLRDALVVIPPAATLAKMGETFAPLLERMIQTRLQVRTLAEVRDTLLPRLISGKLRAPDAETMAEAVL